MMSLSDTKVSHTGRTCKQKVNYFVPCAIIEMTAEMLFGGKMWALCYTWYASVATSQIKTQSCIMTLKDK